MHQAGLRVASKTQAADGLSLNNPSRFELMQMAEDFENRAKELEAQSAQQNRARTLAARTLGSPASAKKSHL
jgi:hypothetical protein